MPRLKHRHAWAMAMHIDSCHSFSSTYSCACGHTLGTYNERNVTDDPYSMVWMEPSYETVRRDEKGRFITPEQRLVECARCLELQAGATPEHGLDLRR